MAIWPLFLCFPLPLCFTKAAANGSTHFGEKMCEWQRKTKKSIVDYCNTASDFRLGLFETMAYSKCSRYVKFTLMTKKYVYISVWLRNEKQNKNHEYDPC